MSERTPTHLEELAKKITATGQELRTEVATIVREAEAKVHQHLIDQGREQLEVVKKKLGR